MAPSSSLDLKALRAPMEAIHASRANFGYDWRLQQLKTLRRMLVEHLDDFSHALYQDLGKNDTEALACELILARQEMDYLIRNLGRLMKTKKVPSPGVAAPCFSRIEQRPKLSPGCLVIAPFNYPISLALQPAAGSLAAGNPTVIKPSELCPACSQLLAKLVDQYFGRSNAALQVVQGAIPETTALLSQPWGLIFFTGSQRVGQIVAEAAADTFTPCVLELGGKCPAYVDGDTCPADIRAIANRIVWAKTLNAGQICVTVDYLVVHQSVIEKLLPELTRTLKLQFGSDPSNSELARIVSTQHGERHVDLIKQAEREARRPGSSTMILSGGSDQCDARSRYVAPTLVLNPPRSSRVLQEEIFGPILPIITVSSREEAIQTMQEMPGTPLCMYVFTTSDRVFNEITSQCRSASAMRNDATIHLASLEFPFSGLGSSGYGVYHGKHTFATFSQEFFAAYRPCAPGMDVGMARYHPHQGIKGKIITDLLMEIPPFPVLHMRTVWAISAIFVACRYVPFLQGLTAQGIQLLAQLLEGGAGFLRSVAND